MIQPEPIGLWNTGVPLLILGVLAVLVPRVLCPRSTRSQAALAAVVGVSAVVITVLGAVVFGAIYAARGISVGAAIAEAPAATMLFFLRQSGLAALVWGPILALVWFSMAQGVERRKGADSARRDECND